MPINFTSLFQDSWNFMRNQKTLVYRFLFIYTLFSLASYALNANLLNNTEISTNTSEQILQNIALSDIALMYIVQQTSFLFLNSWTMLSVDQINRQQSLNLSQSFSAALSKFIGVITLNLLLILPLSLIVLDIFSSIFTHRSPSMFALPGMIFGIFVFIRLFLAPIAYLLDDQKWSKAIGFIWQSGIKRSSTLLLFCLITQFLFGLIAQSLNALANNSFLPVVAATLLAALHLFNLILTYRFYRLFTQKA
ncbi:MAG: hypothetical protein Q4B95_06630 [Lonepinella koalarum]|nr:hypothetical protein [Lonepinella koalarum]